MMPAIAMSLLVVGMAVLLVFDKLWVDNSQQELRTVAEAAALAAAGELAGDDLLLLEDASEARIARARQSAATVAQRNLANGSPVTLDIEEGGDVLIGRYVYDELQDEVVLIETAQHPSHVVVTARRPRGMNPMASASDALDGVTRNELAETATAALSNAVTGVRPSTHVNVPAWPLAILEVDEATGRADTWRQQIERRLGGDNFAYDSAAQQVILGSDGLPEIIVHSAPVDPDTEDQLLANVHIIDIGTGLYPAPVAEQIRLGWSQSHLTAFGGEFSLAAGPLMLECDAVFAGEPAVALSEMIGSCRICVLYNSCIPGQQGLGQLNATRLVAARLMDVRELSDGTLACVLQPGVVATRTAVTSEVIPLGTPSASDPLTSDGVTNPYIYRLFLTH
jgi:hypothetical protein